MKRILSTTQLQSGTVMVFSLQVMRQSDSSFSSVLTKIGNGETLTWNERRMIEARFRTVQWCEENEPDAIRLFHQNISVDAYNRSQVTDATHSIARDDYERVMNYEELMMARQVVHCKSTAETANLAYDIPLKIGYPYMITSNIDVSDGLVNGAIGILRLIEESENETEGTSGPKCLWLEFMDNARIGEKTRAKIRHRYAIDPKLKSPWSPLFRKTASFHVRTPVTCKRTNFPLTLACAMTVHKSQGGTFDKVVFEYTRKMQQQLVYVALSRPKTIDGLFLTSPKNDFTFYHPQNSESLNSLRTELVRLEQYKLLTVDHQMLHRFQETDLILLNQNVQSLRLHVEDLIIDEVLCKASILCLSETWVDNSEHIQMENYRLVAQNKRVNKTGGVAIYIRHGISTSSDSSVQPPLDDSDAGDLCQAVLDINGKRTRIVSVYINPNTSFKQLKTFLMKYHCLFRVDSDGHVDALIICGDFNWNMMKQREESETIHEKEVPTSIDE